MQEPVFVCLAWLLPLCVAGKVDSSESQKETEITSHSLDPKTPFPGYAQGVCNQGSTQGPENMIALTHLFV